ncbi:hypothetical protein L1987_10097 [Smallanthus sonchifolius]|uniref:Uncharacterized protein n=1 Tax=Smallanthus sonchifolius TaxID=185202 RepID=A0ACB9JR65_9ASTR|nr:hypothetical protein L1987_10097 [Smallanthus sonchifolius]
METKISRARAHLLRPSTLDNLQSSIFKFSIWILSLVVQATSLDKMIALDEKMERDYYDGKRDSWNGYDAHEIGRRTHTVYSVKHHFTI